MARYRQIDNVTALLIVAISPALVMLMVGSLCYFAINCFYAGSFDGRLYIATALFVFAAVLIARISIEENREYASMFAVPLSVTTLLSLLKYTDADILFLAPLVAFIWWSTDKLTWDCTVVDRDKDASGNGLLHTIGLDRPEGEAAANETNEELDIGATTSKSATDEKTLWQQWVERRRRTHTPGVWVIYFGIAAIPIFGFGQMLLPAHQFGPSFILLCVYVASALALLMATSFLQMRRYLNQRKLEMSDGMAGVWLSTGGILIVALMFLCLFLPRPNTGYSFVDALSKIDSKEQQASRFSFGKKDAVNDDDVDGSGESEDPADRDSDRGQQKSDEAKQGNRKGDNPENEGGSATDNGKPSRGDSEDSQSSESSADFKNSADSESSADSERDASDESSNQQSQSRQQRDQTGSNERDRSNQSNGAQESESDQAGDNTNSSSRVDVTPRQLPDVLPKISMPPIPKLVYFVVIGLAVVFVFLRYGKQIGSAIGAFVRDFLEMLRRLFGGKPRVHEMEEMEELDLEEEMRPFSSYPDPFLMGTVDQFSPQQLITYTFEALQAWAQERDCARGAEQTPLEFAAQIAGAYEVVGNPAKALARLYNQVAYAPGTVGKDSHEPLKQLWSVLRGA